MCSETSIVTPTTFAHLHIGTGSSTRNDGMNAGYIFRKVESELELRSSSNFHDDYCSARIHGNNR